MGYSITLSIFDTITIVMHNIASFFQVKVNDTKLSAQLDAVNRLIVGQQNTIQALKKYNQNKIYILEMEMNKIKEEIYNREKINGVGCERPQKINQQKEFIQCKAQINQIKNQIISLKRIQQNYQHSFKNYIKQSQNNSFKTITTNKEVNTEEQLIVNAVINEQIIQGSQKQIVSSQRKAYKIKCESKKQRLSMKENTSIKSSLQTIKQNIQTKQSQFFDRITEYIPQNERELDNKIHNLAKQDEKKQILKQQIQTHRISHIKRNRENSVKVNKIGEIMKALQFQSERRMNACLEENNRYLTLAKRIEQLETISMNPHKIQHPKTDYKPSNRNTELMFAMQFKSIQEVWDKKLQKNNKQSAKLKEKQQILQQQLQIALRKLQKQKHRNIQIAAQIKKIEQRKLDEKLIQSLTGLVKRTQRRAEQAVQRKLQIGVFKQQKEQLHESLRYLRQALGEKAEKEGIKHAFMFLEDKLRDVVTLLAQSHGQLLNGALNTLPVKCLSCTRDLDSLKRPNKTSMTSRKQYTLKP